jgi:hypothetical protein
MINRPLGSVTFKVVAFAASIALAGGLAGCSASAASSPVKTTTVQHRWLSKTTVDLGKTRADSTHTTAGPGKAFDEPMKCWIDGRLSSVCPTLAGPAKTYTGPANKAGGRGVAAEASQPPARQHNDAAASTEPPVT